MFYFQQLAPLKAAREVSILPASGGTWQACSVGTLALQLVGLLWELTGSVSHAGQIRRNWWDFRAMQCRVAVVSSPSINLKFFGLIKINVLPVQETEK